MVRFCVSITLQPPLGTFHRRIADQLTGRAAMHDAAYLQHVTPVRTSERQLRAPTASMERTSIRVCVMAYLGIALVVSANPLDGL